MAHSQPPSLIRQQQPELNAGCRPRQPEPARFTSNHNNRIAPEFSMNEVNLARIAHGQERTNENLKNLLEALNNHPANQININAVTVYVNRENPQVEIHFREKLCRF